MHQPVHKQKHGKTMEKLQHKDHFAALQIWKINKHLTRIHLPSFGIIQVIHHALKNRASQVPIHDFFLFSWPSLHGISWNPKRPGTHINKSYPQRCVLFLACFLIYLWHSLAVSRLGRATASSSGSPLNIFRIVHRRFKFQMHNQALSQCSLNPLSKHLGNDLGKWVLRALRALLYSSSTKIWMSFQLIFPWLHRKIGWKIFTINVLHLHWVWAELSWLNHRNKIK